MIAKNVAAVFQKEFHSLNYDINLSSHVSYRCQVLLLLIITIKLAVCVTTSSNMSDISNTIAYIGKTTLILHSGCLIVNTKPDIY